MARPALSNCSSPSVANLFLRRLCECEVQRSLSLPSIGLDQVPVLVTKTSRVTVAFSSFLMKKSKQTKICVFTRDCRNPDSGDVHIRLQGDMTSSNHYGHITGCGKEPRTYTPSFPKTSATGCAHCFTFLHLYQKPHHMAKEAKTESHVQMTRRCRPPSECIKYVWEKIERVGIWSFELFPKQPLNDIR